VEGLRNAIRKSQDMTLPEDPRRGGNKSNSIDREALLSTYGPNPIAPSEVLRLEQRKSIEGVMGVRSRSPRNEMMEAVLVDQMMEQNPYMTRAAARAKVAEMYRRPSPQQRL
jgi:hypothetical protein